MNLSISYRKKLLTYIILAITILAIFFLAYYILFVHSYLTIIWTWLRELSIGRS
ncbi:MAG: hypothetical protein ACJ748_17130 [Flavisolibacter sp.]